MVENVACAKEIFRQVEHTQIADMHHQAHGYFGILRIGNVGNQVLPSPLLVSAIIGLYNEHKLKIFFERVR